MPTNLKHQRDFPKVQVHFQFVSAVLKPHEITIISLIWKNGMGKTHVYKYTAYQNEITSLNKRIFVIARNNQLLVNYKNIMNAFQHSSSVWAKYRQ